MGPPLQGELGRPAIVLPVSLDALRVQRDSGRSTFRMTLKRANYAIAVMVVTTALCADRAAARDIALPTKPAPQQGIARTLASRLTSSFQVVVPAVRVQPSRSNDKVATPRLPIRETASGVRPHLNPFQFRLPPPAL